MTSHYIFSPVPPHAGTLQTSTSKSHSASSEESRRKKKFYLSVALYTSINNDKYVDVNEYNKMEDWNKIRPAM